MENAQVNRRTFRRRAFPDKGAEAAIRSHNETLSVAAMRVNNPDRIVSKIAPESRVLNSRLIACRFYNFVEVTDQYFVRRCQESQKLLPNADALNE